MDSQPMDFIRKIITRLSKTSNYIMSCMRIITIRIMYRNISFGKNLYLAKGVKISITDNGSLMIGQNTSIDRFTNIRINGGNIIIGDDTYIGEFCYIASSKSITIGNGALIASHVVIRDSQHRFDDPNKPIFMQGNTSESTFIGDNVWLGTKVSVLMGAKIGNNAIVGAHSVVRKIIDSDTICSGDPCTFIRKR